MAKRRAQLSNETSTHKTTLAESPEATRKLTEIKTEEVSVVDFPANGEPFFVMKSLNKEEKIEKASREQIPLEKMKELHQRLSDIKKTLELVDKELGNSKVQKSVDKEPVVLKGLFNNVILTLKKIRGEEVEEPLDFETVSKKYEDVEKGNAVSYLTRDRYAYVTQSVSEYVTTYLDGIEHDDDGPMLIPLGLDNGVDDSLEKMTDVVEEETEKEINKEDNTRIEKLEEELSTLKKTLDSANVSTEDVNKKGSKISKDRLKKLKSISKDIGNAHDQMMKFLEDLDIQEETEMSEKNETTEKAADKEEVKEEKAVEKTEDVVEKNTEDKFDTLMSKFDLLCKSLDDKFESLEKSSNERFEKIEETQKEVNSEIQKFASLRVDSKVGTEDETAKVEKSAEELKKEKASFKSIFGLA